MKRKWQHRLQLANGTSPNETSAYSAMIGCSGNTYVERKVDLLHQLGFKNVTVDIFDTCKSEIEVDRRARDIILN